MAEATSYPSDDRAARLIAANRERALRPEPIKFEDWWDSNENPDVAGTVVRMFESDSKQIPGQKVPLVVLRTDGGRLIGVYCGRSVLADKVIEAQPYEGDLLAISYLGMKECETTGRRYHRYAVAVERGDGEGVDDGNPF